MGDLLYGIPARYAGMPCNGRQTCSMYGRPDLRNGRPALWQSNERAALLQVDAEMGGIILKELKAAQPCELVETDGASPPSNDHNPFGSEP